MSCVSFLYAFYIFIALIPFILSLPYFIVSGFPLPDTPCKLKPNNFHKMPETLLWVRCFSWISTTFSYIVYLFMNFSYDCASGLFSSHHIGHLQTYEFVWVTRLHEVWICCMTYMSRYIIQRFMFIYNFTEMLQRQQARNRKMQTLTCRNCTSP